MSDARRDAAGSTTAETLDAVDWEYDPSEELRALVDSAQSYFEDFPWEGLARQRP